jgi:hypothetical protein
MTGFRSSRIVFAAAACMAALSLVAVATVTYVAAAVVDFGRWLVAKFPRERPGWLTQGWHRLHGAIATLRLRQPPPNRRPVVCPRWRMCPST